MLPPNLVWFNRIALAFAAAIAGLVVAERLGLAPTLAPVTSVLYSWVLLLSAMALLFGVANLIWLHVGRVQQGVNEWHLSLLLLAGLLLTLISGLFSSGGTQSILLEWLFDALIAPGYAALFATTGVLVMMAAYRYLRLDRAGALWILAGMLLVVGVQTPLFYEQLPPFAAALADWVLLTGVMATVRGVLLGSGIALVLVLVRLVAQRGGR